MVDQNEVTIFGTAWCGDCHRTRRFLDKYAVQYRWINIDEDKSGEQLVMKINRGMRSVPTIVFGDGSVLVEPNNTTLAQKLGIALS